MFVFFRISTNYQLLFIGFFESKQNNNRLCRLYFGMLTELLMIFDFILTESYQFLSNRNLSKFDRMCVDLNF